MCGIVGIVDHNDTHIDKHIDAMLQVIYKRGPDGEGVYKDNGLTLAMRRLSIIDLKGGDQPFYSDNKQVIAFQNGEIYNYIELTKELKALGYTFISHSDTEVIAHGYSAWGIRTLLQKLEGMFALAIFDKTANKLFLARDRFGEKPLYYTLNNERRQFAYASDLRALFHLEWVEKSLSATALSRYLMLGFTTGNQSIINTIQKVLPAHYLCIDLESFNVENENYYLPNLYAKTIENREKALQEALEKSIDLRLRSDVPVGIFLSGGIDSSLIAAIAATKHRHINTFSIGFHSDQHDESQYAKEVAKHIDSKHHHFMFDEQSFNELLPVVIGEQDEPLADQACLPTYWLSKEARKFVTVVLSGEGGDEVCGGYEYYKQFEKGNKLASLVGGHTTPSGFPPLMSIETCKQFMRKDFLETTVEEEMLFDYLDIAHSGIQKAMATDLMTWLPDNLLVKLDRMAMANSLEGRTPYLSHHLVDLSYGFNQKSWIDQDEYKVLLRKIGKKYLPESIFNRPKQGFVLPMDAWIVSWFKKEGVEHFFTTRSIDELDTNKVIAWVNNQLQSYPFNQRLLFALIVLYEWYGINFKNMH